MAGYSQFLEMEAAQKPYHVEIEISAHGWMTSQEIELDDPKELHGELWCALMDSPIEFENEEVVGRLLIDGKVIFEMRKFGEFISE